MGLDITWAVDWVRRSADVISEHRVELLTLDREIGVEWPIDDPILSEKDQDALPLSAWMDRLPRYEAAER